MSYRVIIRPAAEADLQQAKQYYDERRPGLGEEFISAMRQAMHSLQENPERRAFYYREFRRLLTRRFPYKVFYLVQGERVIVFRILHAKQNHPRRLAE